jgi:hypothetical protein
MHEEILTIGGLIAARETTQTGMVKAMLGAVKEDASYPVKMSLTIDGAIKFELFADYRFPTEKYDYIRADGIGYTLDEAIKSAYCSFQQHLIYRIEKKAKADALEAETEEGKKADESLVENF